MIRDVACVCRGASEGAGKIQGCQHGVGCDIRRTHRLLNNTSMHAPVLLVLVCCRSFAAVHARSHKKKMHFSCLVNIHIVCAATEQSYRRSSCKCGRDSSRVMFLEAEMSTAILFSDDGAFSSVVGLS